VSKMEKGNLKKFFILGIFIITGCAPATPNFAQIHDDHITLIARDTNIGQQTVYENQRLTHFKLKGVDAYCSDLSSTDLKLYRCFVPKGSELVSGLDPLTFKASPLERPIPIKFVKN
jgi:hypothetical protein